MRVPPQTPQPQKTPQSPQQIITAIVLGFVAIGMIWGLYSAMQPSPLVQEWNNAAEEARKAAEASRNNN